MSLICDRHAVHISVESPEAALIELHLSSDGLKEEKETRGAVRSEAELLCIRVEVDGDLVVPPRAHAGFAAEGEVCHIRRESACALAIMCWG